MSNYMLSDMASPPSLRSARRGVALRLAALDYLELTRKEIPTIQEIELQVEAWLYKASGISGIEEAI